MTHEPRYQPPRDSKHIECEVCGARFNKGKARGAKLGGGLCPTCAKRWLTKRIAGVLMCSAKTLEPFARARLRQFSEGEPARHTVVEGEWPPKPHRLPRAFKGYRWGIYA